MKGSCDTAVRASTHRRPAGCHPHSDPSPGCCCAPGCDQGKCSSFNFTRNIVYLGKGKETYVGTTWSGGLDNFTFDDNVYFTVGANATCTGMFNEGAGEPQDFATWKKRGKDAHSVSANPLFSTPFPVDSGVPENVNLKPASPAILNFGFEPIDISRVGPRRQGGRGSIASMAVPAELLEAGHVVSTKEAFSPSETL